ncbi:unnamed protein product [Protopolystoma xenopodis]|uniref:Uncharacterized protein n=1 Tax=Protopolystoma xenopodis TaxID=117903 RepID=A0A3S5B1B2_9PLAT|nr:unnamed protein product [Protopolystoma xenopodis]
MTHDAFCNWLQSDTRSVDHAYRARARLAHRLQPASLAMDTAANVVRVVGPLVAVCQCVPLKSYRSSASSKPHIHIRTRELGLRGCSKGIIASVVLSSRSVHPRAQPVAHNNRLTD